MIDRIRPRALRRYSAIAVLSVALVLAGCTKSSGSEPASTEAANSETATSEATPLTEDEFVMQFGEACATIGEELDDLPAPESFEELAGQSALAQQITVDGIEELRGIAPPEELQDQVDELLLLLEDYAEGFEMLGEAATDEDEPRLDVLLTDLSQRQEILGLKLIDAGGIECGTLTDVT